ncbi:methyltransferase domain-containing protein [Salinactinospora qingdaonensis]|uniref:Protein-L-isoaspartate O-methyltransferase n=1 Tax=Salinactinospora qingdaonensis TaxID=702744 RepID=A0ABP7GDD8_9ACTN
MTPPGPGDLAALAPTPEWAEALRAAPRRLFVPDIAWTVDDGLLDRNADPQTWQAAVDGDGAILTQIDDGETTLTATSPWTARDWTSSCSAPAMVLDFLNLLDPYDGDQVLEIGTGTGWTAGVLSARLGADRVTSVEVDERVAAQARANLERAGLAPRLVVGEGAAGWPASAPYDRVHVTCGVREVPYAWVEQTRPGGVIVLPWTPNGIGNGPKARLTVTGDRAVGRFPGGEAAYMLLRAQRPRRPPIRGQVRESTARVDPRRLTRAGRGLSVALAGMLPGVYVGGGDRSDGSHAVVLRELSGPSHAIATRPVEGGEAAVEQQGPRNLWDQAETAYLTWVGWGEPGVERFGLTVAPQGQHAWLDTPDNRIPELEN